MARRIVPFAFLVAALAAPSLARPDGAERLEIDMSSFKYMPATITLKHGQSYILHFVNQSDGGHDFVARKFFEAAQVAPADRALIDKGAVELQGGEAADIHLIAPAAGHYDARCSHFMHSAFGMKAEIVVT